jgi:hypothetical protein
MVGQERKIFHPRNAAPSLPDRIMAGRFTI